MYTQQKQQIEEKLQLPKNSFIQVTKQELMRQGVREELFLSLKDFIAEEIFINGYALMNYFVEDNGTSVRIKYRNEFEQILEVKITNSAKFPNCEGLYSLLLDI